jgi:hypothetical protein
VPNVHLRGAAGFRNLLSAPLQALTPVIDTTSGGTGNNVSSVTWTHTVGTGLTNSMLVVAVGNSSPTQGANYPTSVTANGAGLLPLQSGSVSSANHTTTFYYLLSPAAGALTMVAKFNTATNITITCDSMSMGNVNQVTPFGTPASVTS